MTTRAGLIVTLALGLLAAPLPADAQPPPAKVPRIGFLWSGSPSDHTYQRQVEAFRQGLRELGYVEGHNLVIEHRWPEGRLERLPALAAELVRLNVDVIIAGAAPAARAAQQATTTIPIVMVNVGEVVEAGFVASLARPGGNMTGPVGMTTELVAKRLQLLTEVVPGLSRVAVLWNAANPVKVRDWTETQLAARVLKLTLQSQEVRGPDDFERAFAAIARERPDALITLGDPLTLVERGRIIEFAARNRLPAMYPQRAYVDAGGLIAYGVEVGAVYRRAAVYMDKILKGAKPADLPVEQPRKFELVINLKTAKTLGLTIPQSILLRADEVIE